MTARRREERLLDVPVAITAVGGRTLETYQVSRVTDLASFVPSLLASKAASGSSASIFLRRAGSSALSAGFDQSVSFVIDGLPMSRGREISLPQFDVQRVEVLKGPQALFFGKNTTGGLISVVTNGPTDQFEAGIKAGYGFKAREKYVDGFVSGPLSDTIKARLAARYSDYDGPFVNTAAEQYSNYIPVEFRTRNSDRRGFAESFGIRGTIEWEPNDNLKFQLKGGYSVVNDGGPTDLVERICGGGRTTPASATFGATYPASPNADCRIDGRSDSSAVPIQVAQTGYRYARDGRLYARFRSHFAVLTGNITSDPFDLTSISGLYHFSQTDLNNVSGEAYPAGFSQFAKFEQVSQELRFQSKFDGQFNILFGGFYAHAKFIFNVDGYITPAPFDPVNQTSVTFARDDGFKTDSLSFFTEGTLKLVEGLELSAGVRYSDEARDSYQRSLPRNSLFAGAFPAGIVLNDRYHEDNLSPQATLRYKPSADSTFYAAYKQGFKAGGFNISQTLTPISTVEQGRFSSETAKGYEVGLRTVQFDGSLSLNITAYSYLYSDLQVQFYDPTANTLIAQNAGKLRTKGIEAEADFRVPGVAGLSFRGAAAYNDAKYHDYIDQCYAGQTVALGCNLNLVGAAFTAQDYEGRTPPKAPHFAGRLGLGYELPISTSGMTLTFSGDASYTSRFNFSDALRPDAVQKAFTKYDAPLNLSGPDRKWSVPLIGRNLTNQLVVAAANDIPFTGGIQTGLTGVADLADMSAFVDNPREIFIEVGIRF